LLVEEYSKLFPNGLSVLCRVLLLGYVYLETRLFREQSTFNFHLFFIEQAHQLALQKRLEVY